MLEEFTIKRKSNVSNVFIFETCDVKRIKQFIGFASEAFKQHRLLIYDLQLQTIVDQSGASVNVGGGYFGFSSQQLLDLLRSRPTILVVKYVYDRRHADAVSDFLMAASHDDAVYRHMSTVAVFAVDSSLFNQGLLRLVHTIYVVPSTPEERRSILESVARKLRAGLSERLGADVELKVTDDLVQASSGLTLHETETAALESFFRERRFSVPVFTEYKVKLLREMGLAFIKPSRGFESVGGYGYLKEYILKRVVKPLRNPDVAKYYGLDVPKGMLLYGPPGCGKTWICKAMAAEVGLPMVSLNPSDLLRGIVGETEMRVKQVTRIVESLAPVILFIDEFDQLALSRESTAITDSGVTRRMTNMLLEWLGSEERKTFVVGATNFVEHVDPAFIRPGRIDEVIPVMPPDLNARYEILRVHTKVVRRVPVEGDDVLMSVAERTHMYTGAELEKVVIEAASLAMDEGSKLVKAEHFDEALKAVEVNVDERVRRVKEMVEKLSRLENVNRRVLKEALKMLREVESDRVATLAAQIGVG